jgi:hypothetical protein
MLRLIKLLCITLICCNLFGQNWQLFPVSQLSHYIVETEVPSVRSFKCDSVLDLGGSSIHLFTGYMGPSEDCYWQNFKWLHGYGTDFTIDSLIYNHDSVVYYFLDGDYPFEFVFKHMAEPGDEWNLSSHLDRKGSCISLGVSEFLGVTDSIKTYILQTVLGDVEFILSKTHGLLQFIPFTNFFVEIPTAKATDAFPFASYQLIGFQKELEIKGFKMPGFSEYFHLSAGDQLLWKNKSWEINGLTTSFLKDSLTSSTISDDSVVYEMLRKKYDSIGQYLGNYEFTVTYYKSEYEYLLQTPASWCVTGNDDLNGELFIIDNMKMNFLGSDTVFSKEYHNNGCIFENSEDECFVVCIDALYQIEYKVTTLEGLVYFSGFYGDELELFGSVIDGQVRGSMNIPPVGIGQISETLINIFPNPTSGIIRLSSDLEIHRVEIYNYMGIKVYANELSDEIDLSNQSPGIYQLIAYSRSGERYIQPVCLY